jgi:hypothetical protein
MPLTGSRRTVGSEWEVEWEVTIIAIISAGWTKQILIALTRKTVFYDGVPGIEFIFPLRVLKIHE